MLSSNGVYLTRKSHEDTLLIRQNMDNKILGNKAALICRENHDIINNSKKFLNEVFNLNSFYVNVKKQLPTDDMLPGEYI